MADLASAVYKSRAELMNRTRSVSPANRPRTLAEVIEGADAFLGLSAGGVLKQAMVAKPLILVLTNPMAGRWHRRRHEHLAGDACESRLVARYEA